MVINLSLSRCHEKLVEAMADDKLRMVTVLADWDSGYSLGGRFDIYDSGNY
ncbi:hypothetical protein CRC_01920 [Cylindrospermopsis raciborskii CS-505]|nr:hypothetical protein CRC_01920 [Cylindrospermopsis raciborskii CS-505]